ncbi:MAG: hypothetical protein H8E18_00910, partial [FCB group bacterium]|nr:hypothetical protein [FCB group bacterium]
MPYTFDILAIQATFQDNWGKLSNKSKYKCNACSYSAKVWDAPDEAPIATVDTRHCLGCKSLVEVPIEFHGGALIEDQDSTPAFLNRCPDAKHSCPKCGEHMTVVLEELYEN